MQRPEQANGEQAPPAAEEARPVESRAPGRKIQKLRDRERQVLLLEQGDESARLDLFFEILIKRLDLPIAGMEAEDYSEWVYEHREVLSFLYQEPPLPEECGPSGALTNDVRRLSSVLVQSAVSLTPPDIARELRSQIEEVPAEVARLRSALNRLQGSFVAFLVVSVCLFILLTASCVGLSGLIHWAWPWPAEPGLALVGTTTGTLLFAGGACGTLAIAILLRLKRKRKDTEFQRCRRELQERKTKLAHEVIRLQAEASRCYQLAISEARKAREGILRDLVKAVEKWRSTVCHEMVKNFFEQGLWISDRFAERLTALLTEIQRPFPTSCRVEIDSLRDDQLERAFRVLTTVIASTIAAKVDLGRSGPLAQLIVSGADPGARMPAAAVLERLETEGVLLTGDPLSEDTRSRMTEALKTLRA